MIIKEKEIICILNQVQQSLEKELIPIELIPINDLLNLIEATLGGTFWKGIGKTSQETFNTITQRYEILLMHCRENKDKDGIVMVLELLKNHYQCTYAILSKEEMDRRTQKYKNLILSIGGAMASMQYWRHKSFHESESKGVYPICLEKGKKGVIYTCLIGLNTSLYQPEYIDIDLDYICFTDNKEKWGTKNGVWIYHKIEKEDAAEDDFTMYYRYKIRSFSILKEYEFSIWINPQMQITGKLELLYKIYGKDASFLAFPAYVHDNLYEVLHTTLNKDDENIELRKKLLHLREEGFPEHSGLISTNLMYRNHRDETLNQVMNIWWQESERCLQLREFGFNYAAWKCAFNYSLCNLFSEWNSFIKNMALNLE